MFERLVDVMNNNCPQSGNRLYKGHNILICIGLVQ